MSMYILGKEIILEDSPILLRLSLDSAPDLDHFEVTGGEWKIVDGALQGCYRENGGGMLYSKLDVPGDILMDFDGELVPPCANDLNFVFKTDGWDAAKQDAGSGYIGGLNGWWEGKAGIEKYPACSPSAQTALFSAVSGVRYHIQTGCIEGHCFLFVDGKLIVELSDPHYHDFAQFGRFGFGTYCSKARYSNLTVYRPLWKKRALSYTPMF